MAKDSGKLSVAFLYDDTIDSSDGVTQYVKTLGAWLSSQGHSVSYLVGESKSSEWRGGKVYPLSKNLRIIWAGNRLSMPIWPKLGRIKDVLGGNQFDVVHVQSPYSPLMSQQVLKRLPDSVGVVGTWHVYPANRRSVLGSKLLKLVYGRSLKRFDKFISVSPAAQAYAKDAFGVHSVVLPNVVKVPESIEPETGDKKQIVFLGRLVERKGAGHLIRAFAVLERDLADVELVIAGTGPQQDELEKLVAKLGVTDSVKFLGYVDEAEKFRLLAGADIACLPSLFGESFGIVLIEAMAAGAQIVLGGDNSGYRTVLGEQPDLLVNPRATDEFAERLARLLEDRPLIKRLHEWQTSVVKQYLVGNVGPQIVELYRSAIANRQTSRHN